MCTRAHYKSIWRRRTKKRERERIMEPRRREATLFCVSMNRRFHHGLLQENRNKSMLQKKMFKKNKLYDHWISNRSMKNLREISSFPNCVLHAGGENFLHQDKPDQSRTFHNNLSVCGLFIIRYISPRLIRDKVEVQFLGKFFSSDALRVFLYQFIAISRGTGC